MSHQLPTEAERAALANPCPHCNALVNLWCSTTNRCGCCGRPADKLHAARVRLS